MGEPRAQQARHAARRGWASRRVPAATVVVAALLLGGCSSSGGDSSGGEAASRPTTTAAADRTSTTTGSDEGDAPVDPEEVPDGYAVLQGEGVGVGLVVPDSWDVVDVDSDELAATAEALAETDPQLGALLEQSTGPLAGATSIAALGPEADGARSAAVVVQLGLSLPTIPEALVTQVEQQLTSLGAEDVAAERVPVRGLAADARALRVGATLMVSGVSIPLRILMVPTSTGIVLVNVRGDAATVDVVLASVTAR